MSIVQASVSHSTPLLLVVGAELPVWVARLARRGFRLLTARTGFEGLVKACCHQPDLVLVSQSLRGGGDPDGPGGLDGRVAVEFLRRCPLTAHIPAATFDPQRLRRPARVTLLLRRAQDRSLEAGAAATSLPAPEPQPAC
jgi:hypothetical protein